MMRRRRQLVALNLVVAALATSIVAWLLWPRPAITRENAARIHVGMTRAEVDTILGGPARDETTGPLVIDWDEAADERARVRHAEELLAVFLGGGPAGNDTVLWQSDDASVWVSFDKDGRVRDCGSMPAHGQREGLLAMLRRWLGFSAPRATGHGILPLRTQRALNVNRAGLLIRAGASCTAAGTAAPSYCPAS